ncbi:MAG TPA: hypothetical protein DHW22_06315 [Planctomycetaceae bacterium]|nr:hypothetical protein [Planctomycetaceae bacterium]
MSDLHLCGILALGSLRAENPWCCWGFESACAGAADTASTNAKANETSCFTQYWFACFNEVVELAWCIGRTGIAGIIQLQGTLQLAGNGSILLQCYLLIYTTR